MGSLRTGIGERIDSSSRTDWVARVVVTPKPGVNDPEGEAILGGLSSLGYDRVDRVRSGRYFELTVLADDAHAARAMVDEMCRRLLANPVMETASWEIRADEQQDAAEAMP